MTVCSQYVKGSGQNVPLQQSKAMDPLIYTGTESIQHVKAVADYDVAANSIRPKSPIYGNQDFVLAFQTPSQANEYRRCLDQTAVVYVDDTFQVCAGDLFLVREPFPVLRPSHNL